MRVSSLRCDNSSRRFSEVQENVVSTLNRKILTCVVLVGCRVKHVEPGNMSREMKEYSPLFYYCYQRLIVSTSAPRPYYNQSRNQLFRQ